MTLADDIKSLRVNSVFVSCGLLVVGCKQYPVISIQLSILNGEMRILIKPLRVNSFSSSFKIPCSVFDIQFPRRNTGGEALSSALCHRVPPARGWSGWCLFTGYVSVIIFIHVPEVILWPIKFGS